MEKDIITESFLLVSEKNLRIEKRSLEQLQKRGASPNVIAEQQKVVGELTENMRKPKLQQKESKNNLEKLPLHSMSLMMQQAMQPPFLRK